MESSESGAARHATNAKRAFREQLRDRERLTRKVLRRVRGIFIRAGRAKRATGEIVERLEDLHVLVAVYPESRELLHVFEDELKRCASFGDEGHSLAAAFRERAEYLAEVALLRSDADRLGTRERRRPLFTKYLRQSDVGIG